jgi:hypothetical protein
VRHPVKQVYFFENVAISVKMRLKRGMSHPVLQLGSGFPDGRGRLFPGFVTLALPQPLKIRPKPS